MSRAALRLVYPKSQDCTARLSIVVVLGGEIRDVVRVYDWRDSAEIGDLAVRRERRLRKRASSKHGAQQFAIWQRDGGESERSARSTGAR
jgi:hypothetical protein